MIYSWTLEYENNSYSICKKIPTNNKILYLYYIYSQDCYFSNVDKIESITNENTRFQRKLCNTHVTGKFLFQEN